MQQAPSNREGDDNEAGNDVSPDEELEFTEPDYYEGGEDFVPTRGWIAPTLATAAIIAWTVLYGWAMRGELSGTASAAPSEWTGWITDWSIPVLLICVVWLLSLRNSRSEARRFGNTAAMLSHESERLETRLSTVNRELSLAREFLGAQSLELESLGRVASERIGAHASELQGLIGDNGEQVEAIRNASDAALSNMKRLRDDLPVIANSARDVTNHVGNAGRTAQDQLDGLVTGFERLNHFGQATESQISALETRIGETLTGFETTLGRIEQSVASRYDVLQQKTGTYRHEIDEAERQAIGSLIERFELLQSETKAITAALRQAEADAMGQLEETRDHFYDKMSETVESLDKLDHEAIAASKRRVKELHEEAARFDDQLTARDRRFADEIARRQDEFQAREAQASDALAQRLADLDQALAQRREAQIEQTEKLLTHSTRITEEMENLRLLIQEIAAQGNTTRSGLSEGLGALGENLSKKRQVLGETEEQLNDVTEKAVRLLEIIQSGARHSREDLAGAIGQATDGLQSVEQRASDLSGVMFTTRDHAEGLGDYLLETTNRIEAADSSLAELKTRLAEQTEDALARLNGLRGGFARLADESQNLAHGSQEQVRETLAVLEEAIDAAFHAFEEGARAKVDALADSLSKDAVAEIERALREESAETIDKFENAAARASGAGREVTIQLRDQLTKVNDLTLNLERRVAVAREQAEEDIGSEFARRMALITDSLNSNSIDIAAALSSDVADTAWDSYLKGDRGIFTRRAVRLVDSGQARAIANLYQRDDTFKRSVNRYIHDFEAMLRSMLSTRDGNSLGVTILGSDIGKLYVLLAQALERIRA